MDSKRSSIEYSKRMNLAVDYLQNHIEAEFDLKALADAASFSPFHFHRLYTRIMGETPGETLKRIRLEKSLKLLFFNLNESITDIALGCGFSSSSNFSRAFQKYYHCSPRFFRKKGYERCKSVKYENSNAGKVFNDMKCYNRYKELNKKVFLKNIPDYHYAYIRHYGAYGRPGPGGAWEKIKNQADKYGLSRGGYLQIVVIHDYPGITPDEKCRLDTGITLEKRQTWLPFNTSLNLGKIKGGRYAVIGYEGPVSGIKSFCSDFFDNWLPFSGYQPDDKPLLNIFRKGHNDPEDEKLISDICVPVRQLKEKILW
jgi:AraC family transcriptional regulator